MIQGLNHTSTIPLVILFVLNMPIKNGFEVLKELKGSHLLKKLPVVIFSTSDDNTSIESSRRLVAEMYIVKPSSFISLINIFKFIIAIDWRTYSGSTEDFVYKVD